MVGIQVDVLRPPHCTTPAAVKANKNKKQVPSRASLLGSLPVLSAHSYASNWQMPFLNQRKGENGFRFFFMIKSPRKNVPGVRIEPATVCLLGIRASDRASTPGLKDIYKHGINGEFRILLWNICKTGIIQVNLRLKSRCKMTRNGFSCILGFQNFPGGGPPHKKTYTGRFWISSFYPTSAAHRQTRPPPPNPSIILMQKTLLFAGHLPMIIYDFVIHGFICSLWAELPLPPPFSPIFIPLLLLGYGYCYAKVSVQRLFAGGGKFYWLSKFSTD